MGMIMCIKKSLLTESALVQKKVRLESLLKSSKYLLPEEIGDEYEEWKFSTSVRSINSNKVVFYSNKEGNRVYYHTFGKVNKMIHEGYDLVMYLSSLSIDRMIDSFADRTQFNTIMFNSSMFRVLGLYYDGVLDPIVYSQIYIKDDAFDSFIEPSLALGYGVCSVQEMRTRPEGNIEALLHEIVEVKEG